MSDSEKKDETMESISNTEKGLIIYDHFEFWTKGKKSNPKFFIYLTIKKLSERSDLNFYFSFDLNFKLFCLLRLLRNFLENLWKFISQQS